MELGVNGLVLFVQSAALPAVIVEHPLRPLGIE